MGFQVDQATYILWFWLKEIARWDLRLMGKKKRKKRREKERKKREEKRRKIKKKRKEVRSLDKWIQQVRNTRRQVFLYKAYYAKH
jgi:hypothetical protein